VNSNPSKKYTALSDLERFSTGYIIIGSTLFEVDKGSVEDTQELTSKTIGDKVAEARTLAGLDNRKRIVYDDEGIYNEDIVAGENELITAAEAFDKLDEEDKEDYESLAEYYSSH